MPLSTAALSEIAHRLTGGSSGNPQHKWFFTENRLAGSSLTQPAAGKIRDFWRMNKSNGAHGAAPASTAMSTLGGATLGALPISTVSAVTGGFTYLLGWEVVNMASTGAGTWMLYDRLMHGGPYANNTTAAVGTTGTAQTVERYNSTVSTAATFAGGNQIWIVNSTALGSTAVSARVKYTNQVGTSGKLTQLVPVAGAASSQIYQVTNCPLADGDTGVLAVESFQVGVGGAAQGVAAAHDVIIARPIATISVPYVGGGTIRDFVAGLPTIPIIQPNACLAFTMMVSAAAGEPAALHGLHFVDGP